MTRPSAVLVDAVRGAAFRRLLRTGSAADLGELAADLGRPVDEIDAAVTSLNRAGRVRLDVAGRVAGSAGLSVEPDRHTIEVGGRRFWTWCAYDVLGIFGALRADGEAHSTSPSSGLALRVGFRHGRPLPAQVVLFRPGDERLSRCRNVYEEWCPNSNFFESQAAAWTWSRARGVSGRVLALDEAGKLAAGDWESVVGGKRL